MRRVITVLVLVMAVLAPVGAQAQDGPDLTDECGVLERSDRTALPWQDVCAADFDAVFDTDTGLTDITVTMVVDGDTGLRTPTSYESIFHAGGCQYWMMHDDAEGVVAARDRVQVRCGSSEDVPCDPPVLEEVGFFCFTLPDPTFHPMTFTAEGNVVTMTMVADGDAVPLTDGDVIDHFAVATAAQVAGEGGWDSSCRISDGQPHDCTSDKGDHVYTRALGHEVSDPDVS